MSADRFGTAARTSRSTSGDKVRPAASTVFFVCSTNALPKLSWSNPRSFVQIALRR